MLERLLAPYLTDTMNMCILLMVPPPSCFALWRSLLSLLFHCIAEHFNCRFVVIVTYMFLPIFFGSSFLRFVRFALFSLIQQILLARIQHVTSSGFLPTPSLPDIDSEAPLETLPDPSEVEVKGTCSAAGDEAASSGMKEGATLSKAAGAARQVPPLHPAKPRQAWDESSQQVV